MISIKGSLNIKIEEQIPPKQCEISYWQNIFPSQPGKKLSHMKEKSNKADI
jgi:hypothetical protein